MGKDERNIISKKELPSEETPKEKNNRDAHLEGLSEDEKKMIKLIASIFINFLVNGE